MIEYFLLIVGLIFVIKGADYLIDGSSNIARKLGVPNLIIGLTIVALGTSLPELIVNIFSAVSGNTDIALGNIIGSNMTNILLVLGIIAFLTPIKVHLSTVWKEIPFSFLGAFVLFIAINDLAFDGTASYLSRTDGIMLLLFFIVFIYYIVEKALKDKHVVDEEDQKLSYTKSVSLIIFGSLILYVGGDFVVKNILIITNEFHVSQFLISAIALAIGTSLPELVTSIVSIRKNQPDMAVGNIVGSNIFNIFLVLGITALIHPVPFNPIYDIDLVFLMIASLMLFVYMFIFKKHELNRTKGISFLIIYFLYVAFIIIRG